MAESVTDIAALDGRFVRTCRNVVTKPGSHVRDYAHGRRSPFTPPVRLFLLVSLLFFTTLQLTDKHLVVVDVELRDRGEVQAEAQAFLEGMEEGFTEDEREAAREAIEQLGEVPPVVAESVRSEAEEGESDGETEVNFKLSEEGLTADIETDEESGGWVPIPHVMFLHEAPEREYSPEERDYIRQMIDFDSFELNGREVDSELFVERILSILRNPAAFSNALNEWIPRLMLVFVPLMALLGAAVIRGRDALIYDHLLLSLQTHAIGFLVITINVWTGGFMPGSVGGLLFFLGVPIYYLLAIKGAFKRSWRKSVFATLFVFSIYSFLFWLGLFIAAAYSFLEIF
nr:DUF3667 domain-containing protein [Parvularcula maris]